MEPINLEEKYYKESIFKTILTFILLNTVISIFLYTFHVSAQKEDLFTAIRDKSYSIGRSVTDLLEKSISYGVPLQNINGGNEFLTKKLNAAKEIEYIVITDEDGEIIAKNDDINEGGSIRGFKESLKGQLISFSNMQKETDEAPYPFEIYYFHNLPFKIESNGKVHGYVHVGISNRAVNANIQNIFYDIAIILLASLIIGYEFLSYFYRNSVIQPMRDFNNAIRNIINKNFSEISAPRTTQTFGGVLKNLNGIIENTVITYLLAKKRIQSIKEGNFHKPLLVESIKYLGNKFNFPNTELHEKPILPIVTNLRLVMFLVVFSEAMLLGAIPSYANQFYEPTLFVSKTMLSALPVIMNMAFTALFIPFVPLVCRHLGYRKTFIVGSIIMAVSYFIGAFWVSLAGLLIARAIAAIGFSVCYVSCQNYVASYATDDTRIQSFAIFGIASGAGFICGAPIGGILIDNIGYSALFLFSSFASLLSVIMAKNYIIDHKEVAAAPSAKGVLNLFKIPDLTISVLFSALPTRLLFSAVICYLYPLYLVSLGNSQSSIGRIIMIFGIISFFFSPFAPRFVMKVKNPSLAAAILSCIIAIPMVFDIFMQSTEGIVLQIALNTLCTIFFISAFMAHLDHISEREKDSFSKSAVLGFYFIFERIGMILGPTFTGLILSRTDFPHTLLYLGYALLILNIAYIGYNLLSQKNRKNQRGIK